eukprot:scaffold261673_cov22-Tisochrysis_lutea.AAC.1
MHLGSSWLWDVLMLHIARDPRWPELITTALHAAKHALAKTYTISDNCPACRKAMHLAKTISKNCPARHKAMHFTCHKACHKLMHCACHKACQKLMHCACHKAMHLAKTIGKNCPACHKACHKLMHCACHKAMHLAKTTAMCFCLPDASSVFICKPGVFLLQSTIDTMLDPLPTALLLRKPLLYCPNRSFCNLFTRCSGTWVQRRLVELPQSIRQVVIVSPQPVLCPKIENIAEAAIKFLPGE